MKDVHDIGGMRGFGPIVRDEAQLHEEWERRVLGTVLSVREHHLFSIDAFRHAIERIPEAVYVSATYFVRWRMAIERLLLERDIITREELDRRFEECSTGKVVEPRKPRDGTQYPRGIHGSGYYRKINTPAVFKRGDHVETRNLKPIGHTRLPGYARSKTGVVARVYPAYVFPDTAAHERGENPQYLYSVRFSGYMLWGKDAEPNSAVYIDLFESYLKQVSESIPEGNNER